MNKFFIIFLLISFFYSEAVPSKPRAYIKVSFYLSNKALEKAEEIKKLEKNLEISFFNCSSSVRRHYLGIEILNSKISKTYQGGFVETSLAPASEVIKLTKCFQRKVKEFLPFTMIEEKSLFIYVEKSVSYE